ncbi:MAG: hypothetical protein JWM42_64, partial [Burkholderia sp.]|nr:hypothetical protein [Burkholderia sp.]
RYRRLLSRQGIEANDSREARIRGGFIEPDDEIQPYS